MSTLAIPPQRVKLYRALWDRWIIVLRVLFDLGANAHPVKWRAVADTLLVDKKTCQKYIHGLVREGRITAAGEGFMLTQAGMDVLLENGQGEFLPAGGENFSPLKESVVVVNSELNQLTPPTPPESGKIPGEIFSPDVLLALQHVPDLFDGSEITLKGLPQFLHIEKVLGWIAYVYDKRTSLSAPVGLLYSKLRDPHQSPYTKYMKAPGDFLPAEYMDAIGRFKRMCERCQITFTSLAEYEGHRSSCIMTPVDDEEEIVIHTIEGDETVETPINGGMNARQAWQSLLGQLKMEMLKSTFQTWLEPTRPIHYEAGLLQIGVRNQLACDWLESRMVSTVDRMLVGILNSSVTVKFVVAVKTAEVE